MVHHGLALPYAPEDELCKFCSSDPWVIRLKRKGPLVGKILYQPTLNLPSCAKRASLKLQ